MLASILPGFRAVRTPLLTGYLYFAVLWLVFGEDLVPSTADDGLPGRFATLFDMLGFAAATASLSIGAYLVGSVLTIHRWPSQDRLIKVLGDAIKAIPPVLKPLSRDSRGQQGLVFLRPPGGLTPSVPLLRNRLHPEPRYWLSPHLGWAYGAFDRLPRPITPNTLRAAPQDFSLFLSWIDLRWRSGTTEEITHWSPPADPYDPADFDLSDFEPVEDAGREAPDEEAERRPPLEGDTPLSAAQLVSSYLVNLLADDIGLAAARLRVTHPNLWDEYDQRRSEAELRYSITPPLALVCIAAAMWWSAWAAFLLVLPSVLTWQGYRSECSSVVSIADAIDAEIAVPPKLAALKRLAGWTEDTTAPDERRLS
jgi:hypothetical protein